jgi:hypothetical protein
MSKRVKIAYSPDLSQVGQVVTIEDDLEAMALVAEGRAVVVESSDALAERSKAELLERAGALGLGVSERDSKADIAAAIEGAETGQG